MPRGSRDDRQVRGAWHARCPVDLTDEVRVPVIHRFGPYAFYFFSDENRGTFEPPHVHVRSGNGEAVFWLSPVSLREAGGYNPREIERVRRIVVGSRGMMLRRWHEFFDRVP